MKLQRLEQKNVKKFQMLTPPTAATGMRLIPYPNAFVRAINEKGTPHVGLQLRLFHPLCFPRGWCARVLSTRSCRHREKNPLTQARNTRRPHRGGKDGGAQRPVLQSRVESHNKRYRLDYERTRAQVVTAQGEDARTRSEQKI